MRSSRRYLRPFRFLIAIMVSPPSQPPASLTRNTTPDEEHLRLLTQQLPCVIWTTDVNLNFTSFAGSDLKGLHLPIEDPVVAGQRVHQDKPRRALRRRRYLLRLRDHGNSASSGCQMFQDTRVHPTATGRLARHASRGRKCLPRPNSMKVQAHWFGRLEYHLRTEVNRP